MNRSVAALVLVLALAGCGSEPPVRAPAAPSPGPQGTDAAPGATAPSTTGSAPPAAPAGSPDARPPGLGSIRVLTAQEAREQADINGTDTAGVVAGLSFSDANGDNSVVLREVESGRTRSLYAEHAVARPPEGRAPEPAHGA